MNYRNDKFNNKETTKRNKSEQFILKPASNMSRHAPWRPGPRISRVQLKWSLDQICLSSQCNRYCIESKWSGHTGMWFTFLVILSCKLLNNRYWFTFMWFSRFLMETATDTRLSVMFWIHQSGLSSWSFILRPGTLISLWDWSFLVAEKVTRHYVAFVKGWHVLACPVLGTNRVLCLQRFKASELFKSTCLPEPNSHPRVLLT